MFERLIGILSRNKLKKFIALAVSFALWLFVMGVQNPVITGSYNLPVSVINVPQGYRAIYDEKKVRVKIRAQHSFFTENNESSLQLFANLENHTEGQYELPIESSFPQGVEVQSIFPDTIFVKLEPIIERSAEAEIIVNGSVASGSMIDEIRKSENRVTVVGPKGSVEEVQRVIGYLYLNGNAEDFDINIPLTAIDKDGRTVKNVRVVPSSITADVLIKNSLKSKTVPVTANLTPPDGKEIVTVVVSPNTVEISGPEEIINPTESVQTDSVNIPADITNFVGKFKLNLPPNVTSKVSEVSITAVLK